MALKIVPKAVQNAMLLRDGSPVALAWRDDDTVLLTIPYFQRDDIDTVVKLEP